MEEEVGQEQITQEQTIKPHKSRALKFIAIIVILALMISSSIILYNALKKESPASKTTVGIDEKIEKCLEEDSAECRLLFSSPGIAEECKKLEQSSRDKCFYKASGINIYCEQISDENLKNRCFLENIRSNE